VNHRFVVPALGLVALSATAASAQEIAKGVFLDGYVDSVFTGTTYSPDNTPATDGFTAGAVLKVGWNIGDKVKALVATKVADLGASGSSITLNEAYGTVDAGNGLSIASGVSTGPFGYYAPYATGLTTINYALTTRLYSANPLGVWATYAPNDKFSGVFIVANGLANSNGIGGKPAHATDPNSTNADANNNVSPGLHLNYNPIPEVALVLEGYIDPNAGGIKADGSKGNISTVGFNAQYKKDAWLVAGEIIDRSTGYAGETESDSFNELAWAAFVTYTIPGTKVPMAGTLQVSQYLSGKTNATTNTYAFNPATGGSMVTGTTSSAVDSDSLTEIQAALLTNPTGSSQFGLNLEVFYTINGKNNNADDKADTALGVAVEGLYVIP
jgi:hypothetical protein